MLSNLFNFYPYEQQLQFDTQNFDVCFYNDNNLQRGLHIMIYVPTGMNDKNIDNSLRWGNIDEFYIRSSPFCFVWYVFCSVQAETYQSLPKHHRGLL